mmetsp:Transcript_139167/g.346901  ORF Transcript_139167/g.346901 Transcript_139167/m.346901 type:complete len:262 (+) Transcript_139167:357-1142(+)
MVFEGGLRAEGHHLQPPHARGLRPLLLLHLELHQGPLAVPCFHAWRCATLVSRPAPIALRLFNAGEQADVRHGREGHRVPRCRRLRAQEALVSGKGDGRPTPEGRGPHQARGRGTLPHGRLHLGGLGPRRSLPEHLGSRGFRHRGERGRGRDRVLAGGPRGAVLPGLLRRLQVLQEARHQPLHLGPGLHGQGRDGGRWQAALLLPGEADLPFYGHKLLQRVWGGPCTVSREDPPGCTSGEGLPFGLWHLHRLGRRLEHSPG